MVLKDHIKGNGGSPVSYKSIPRSLNKSLSININDIDTILWYLRIRKLDDKKGELLHQITGSEGSYIDISDIFIQDMKKLIEDLCEKMKYLDLKDGCVEIKFENNNENMNKNMNKSTGSIKIFVEDLLAFFGKAVSYYNIFII
jgi:hypothetical protein